MLKRLFSLLALALALAAAAAAQSASEEQRALRVGLYISPPFVMRQDSGFTGMAVDLWEEVAAAQNLQFSYRAYPSARELVDATAKGEIDVAVTNLTVTESRAQRIDFTQPWFDAGLRIMVDKDRGSGFRDLLRGLKDSGQLRAFVWLFSVILLATVVFTLFDRRFDKDFPRRWRDGLAESFYAVMSVVTSGRVVRKNLFGWIGRIVQGLWLACGVAVVSYITASIASVMTALSLTSQINGLRDLPGKTVGVFAGSVAQEYAEGHSIDSREYEGIDDAVQALHAGEIDAIVADAPVLAYYAHIHPEIPLLLVGKIFHPDKYAFALPVHSALTRPLSVDIIGAYEDGRIAELRKQYFGPRQ